jgi:tetratricopeptide (TPR) repeat protein
MTGLRTIGLVVVVFALSTSARYFTKGILTVDDPAALVSESAEDKDDPVVDALCLKGLMYSSKGQHDKAIAAYTEAIGRDPKYAFSYIARGDVYQARGDLDRALLDYDAAARLDPKNEAAKERADLVREQRRKQ